MPDQDRASERQQIGWYNLRTGSLHKMRMDTHPEVWWVPVYVDTSELDTAVRALHEHGRRKAHQ